MRDKVGTSASRDEPAGAPSRAFYIGGVLLLSLILTLTGLGSRDLWDPDETRYAAVAQTMMHSGEWIVPHLNGNIYGEKPPLSFWLMAGCFKLFGTNETAARLPSALAGILTALLVFLFAERCFGTRGGFTAGIAAATAPALAQLSRWAIIDPLLTLCITLASYLLFIGVEEEIRRKYAFPVAGIAMGAGLLIKGPPAVLPVLVILVYAAIFRNIRSVANRHLALCLAIAAAIMAAWIVPACVRGGSAYTQEILVHQTVGRYAQGWIHRKPAYYYLYVLPGLLMPWTLFLPGAVIKLLRREQRFERSNPLAVKGIIFALVWIVVFGLFFSTSKSKKPLYILPTLPAAAMLVGGLISNAKKDEDVDSNRSAADGWITVPIILTAACVVLIAAALPVGARYYLKLPLDRLIPLILLGGALGIVSFVSAYITAKGRQTSAFALIALALAGLNLTLSLVALEMFDVRKSGKEFASRVGYISQGARLATFGLRPQSFIFYGRHSIVPRFKNAEAAADFLRSTQKSYLALPEKDMIALRQSKGVVVFDGTAWGKETVLIANKTAAEDFSARIRAREGGFTH